MIPSIAKPVPPTAVIAEELGYFPVTNAKGTTVYIPKRVSRTPSSAQAMALAEHLQKRGAIMYGAFWCPHCARQKELFGREAWALIRYVECAAQGYNGQPALCATKQVDGFPTWNLGKGVVVSGERPLSVLAKASQYPGVIDEQLEENVPGGLGNAACQ